MLGFREININDKERITKALEYSQFMGCEYNFANNMAWRRLGDSKIAFFKDFYICGAFGGYSERPRFILPTGKGDIREVIAELKSYSESVGYPLMLTGEDYLFWQLVVLQIVGEVIITDFIKSHPQM